MKIMFALSLLQRNSHKLIYALLNIFGFSSRRKDDRSWQLRSSGEYARYSCNSSGVFKERSQAVA